jgi:hypothetical protein
VIDNEKLTSKSYSSGPASGSRMKGSASTPGTLAVEGGTEICVDSGLRMALCPPASNAQFLAERDRLVGIEQLAYFIVDAVPLRRMELQCSVKTTIFARGNSRASGLAKLTGCGERKYFLPIGD